MTWIRRGCAIAVGGLAAASLLVQMPAAGAVAGSGVDGTVVVQRSLPDTEILEGPPTETKSRKARFVFAAEPGATFTCALDKKVATPCTSPYKVKKLKLGKHKVTITATDTTGVESSPAKYKWKVIRKPVTPPCTGECRAAAAGDGYQGYVACSTKKSAKPVHECKASQTKAAFFVSRNHDATFKVCVNYPKGQRLCASDQPAPKGKKQFVTIATADTGRHKVSWYVGGKKVEGWTFEVIEG